MLRVVAGDLGGDVDVERTEADEEPVHRHRLIAEAARVVDDEVEGAEAVDEVTEHALAGVEDVAIRMETLASAAICPMVRANCRRMVKKDTMGWLMLGPMDAGGSEEG